MGRTATKPAKKLTADKPAPVGRPTDYTPAMCDRVIALGERGFSLAQMAADIGVVRETLRLWAQEHAEFMGAMGKARELSLAWWEHIAQNHMIERPGGDKINSGLWSRSMGARFPDDYRENSKVEHTGQLTVMLSDAESRL